MSLRGRDRVAILALLGLVLVGAYYMLALKPERQKVTTLNAQIAVKQQAYAQAQQAVVAARTARASLQSTLAQQRAVNVAVPSAANIPPLLRALQQASAAAHVDMQGIAIAASTTGAATATSTPTTSTGGATVTPIQLTFKGSYAALDGLLRRLDGFVAIFGSQLKATGRLINVSSIQLGGTSGLTANVNANIYQLSPSTTAGASTTTAASTTTGAASTAGGS